MGKLLLIFRLAARDLQRRRDEAAMLLIVITAATTALTLGLVLHGVTAQPCPARIGARRPVAEILQSGTA